MTFFFASSACTHTHKRINGLHQGMSAPPHALHIYRPSVSPPACLIACHACPPVRSPAPLTSLSACLPAHLPSSPACRHTCPIALPALPARPPACPFLSTHPITYPTHPHARCYIHAGDFPLAWTHKSPASPSCCLCRSMGCL